MKETWIAMFSHTGNEIFRISKKLKRFPDRVITNQAPGNICKQLASHPMLEILYCASKPESPEYERMFSRGLPVITLHGWMRIIPGEVCDHNNIINLHPGLITKYPELKGKDPQIKAWEANHPYVGCVLHKCIGEVDSGDIIDKKWSHNKFNTFDEMDQRLRANAEQLWVKYLNRVLDQPEDNE